MRVEARGAQGVEVSGVHALLFEDLDGDGEPGAGEVHATSFATLGVAGRRIRPGVLRLPEGTPKGSLMLHVEVTTNQGTRTAVWGL